MESAATILQGVERQWEAPAHAETSNLKVLEKPPLGDEISSPEFVIPTPIRVRGRTTLARFGPPLVFALAIAAIIYLWPPF
jgi:hypothetical protein